MSARLAADNGGERLGDLLDRAAEPGRVALVTAETGETLSYEGLTAAAASLAGRLATLGAGRGSRIALVLPDGPDFLQLLLAVTRLGAIAAPLNAAYKRDEYEFYLDDLQPQLLLVPIGELPAAREAVAADVQVVDVSREGGAIGLSAGEAAIEDERAFEPAEPDDVALLLHTSGTTSRPKQVPLLTAQPDGLRADDRRLLRARPRRRLVLRDAALPRARPRRLDASAPSRAAARSSCRDGSRRARSGRRLAPAASRGSRPGRRSTQMILERDDGGGAPETLRFARSCSSALSPALMQRLEEALGVPVVEAYGMTEASHQMASNPLPPGARKPGSVGVPSGVGDPDRGRRRPDGCRRGGGRGRDPRAPASPPGYLNNPEANAEPSSTVGSGPATAAPSTPTATSGSRAG